MQDLPEYIGCCILCISRPKYRYLLYGFLVTAAVMYWSFYMLVVSDSEVDATNEIRGIHEELHIPYPRIYKGNIVIDEALLQRNDNEENIRRIGEQLASRLVEAEIESRHPGKHFKRKVARANGTKIEQLVDIVDKNGQKLANSNIQIKRNNQAEARKRANIDEPTIVSAATVPRIQQPGIPVDIVLNPGQQDKYRDDDQQIQSNRGKQGSNKQGPPEQVPEKTTRIRNQQRKTNDIFGIISEIPAVELKAKAENFRDNMLRAEEEDQETNRRKQDAIVNRLHSENSNNLKNTPRRDIFAMINEIPPVDDSDPSNLGGDNFQQPVDAGQQQSNHNNINRDNQRQNNAEGVEVSRFQAKEERNEHAMVRNSDEGLKLQHEAGQNLPPVVDIPKSKENIDSQIVQKLENENVKENLSGKTNKPIGNYAGQLSDLSDKYFNKNHFGVIDEIPEPDIITPDEQPNFQPENEQAIDREFNKLDDIQKIPEIPIVDNQSNLLPRSKPKSLAEGDANIIKVPENQNSNNFQGDKLQQPDPAAKNNREPETKQRLNQANAEPITEESIIHRLYGRQGAEQLRGLNENDNRINNRDPALKNLIELQKSFDNKANLEARNRGIIHELIKQQQSGQ